MKFHTGAFTGSSVVPCGLIKWWNEGQTFTDRQTDRHDEASIRFLQFYECP